MINHQWKLPIRAPICMKLLVMFGADVRCCQQPPVESRADLGHSIIQKSEERNSENVSPQINKDQHPFSDSPS